ncbi:MAG: right-handed parallel beta-helix repeat-containing protein [bacterium]|nr:right-handed parallel beta-helix repeat-containing protein [bacterium]
MHWIKSLTVLVLLMVLALGLPAFAQPQISGPLSGALGPGDYIVVGDIQVNAGRTLTIAPGTTFLHNGHWDWTISGTLTAVGTATDSIIFTRQQPVPEHRWGGLRFQPGATNGQISYCAIDHGLVGTTSTLKGANIVTNGAAISVTHSTITFGDAYWGGAGIYATNVTGLVVENCAITDNLANADNGGGILLNSCQQASITNNVIARNSSTGT